MRTVVAITMKGLRDAKTRLSGQLDSDSRMQIASSLFDSARLFFSQNFPAFSRLVITPCKSIAERSERSGWQVLQEKPDIGLSAAAKEALLWAKERGFERLLIVPADVAIWDQNEIFALLRQGCRHDVVIGRAHDDGTNAILLNLNKVSTFSFQYGSQSASKHALACQLEALTCSVVSLPRLAHDIDTVDDWRRLGSLLNLS